MNRDIESLLEHLTLIQKVSFLSGRDFWRTAAVPELGIRGVTMTDGPHGVRIGNETLEGKTAGTATAFPTGVALASTWDVALMTRVGVTLAEEARAASCDVLLGPCVNLVRTPVAGRNFETFAEDPFLAGKLGAAYVRGVQSRGIAASVKHFACNNQEYERSRGDSRVSERALRELYLAQFEMIVKEADPWTVMCSYNRVNGDYASQNRWLLTEVLKREWGFTGVVVSDWNANHEIYRSVAAGLDLEMPGPAVYFGKLLENAVKSWQIDEACIDEAVRRMLRLEQRVASYRQAHPDDHGSFSNPEHTALACEASAASLVLLKNDRRALPLDPSSVKRLAVIGPTAAVASYGGGGSSVVPCAYTISPLDGLKEAYGPGTEVVYARGCEDRVKADSFAYVGLAVTHEAGPGFRQETFGNRTLAGEPVLTSATAEIDFWQIFLHDGRLDPRCFSIRWSGELRVRRSGEYRFKMSYQGNVRLFVDDDLVDADEDWHDLPPYPFYTVRKSRWVRLETGRAYCVRVELVNTLESERNALILKAEYAITEAEVQAQIDEALALVRTSDRTIVVAGHSAGYEQEGIDRDDLVLPGAQNRLIEAVLAVDPQAVIVLNTGAPVEMPWAARARAIVQAHFFGQEGGRALASVVSGAVNPSGRLTTTYPIRYEDNPTHAFYPGGRKAEYGEGVLMGYRYYDTRGVPVLFPFGHGLSYTTFGYAQLEVSGRLDDGTLQASVSVTNTGTRSGAEVVQLYIGDRESSEPRPVRELKGFAKVELLPGETQRVVFPLVERSFEFFSETRGTWLWEPGEFELAVGASSRDLRLSIHLTL